MNKKTIIILAVVIITVILGTWWIITAPQRNITKILETSAELAENSLLDSPEAKIEKSQKLVLNFSQAATIEWQENGALSSGELSGREEIYQKILAAKNSVSYQIELSDIVIEISADKKLATAKFNLVTTQRQNVLAYQAIARLGRGGGQWQITKIILTSVLHK